MDPQNQPPQIPLPFDPLVKHSEKPKLFFIFGLIILVVIVGLGGYILGTTTTQNKSLPKEEASTALSPTLKPGCYYQEVVCVKAPCPPILMCTTPTAVPTLDSTANWKTYTNTKQEYQISYPNNWFIYPEKLGGTIDQYKSTLLSSFDLSNQLSVPRGLDIPSTEATLTISLIADGKLESESIDDYLKRNNIAPVPNQKVIVGDGILGRMGTNELSTVIYTFRNNKIYSFSYRETTEAKKNIINQILSTFKFTE